LDIQGRREIHRGFGFCRLEFSFMTRNLRIHICVGNFFLPERLLERRSSKLQASNG
jgi:hypothetical protein